MERRHTFLKILNARVCALWWAKHGRPRKKRQRVSFNSYDNGDDDDVKYGVVDTIFSPSLEAEAIIIYQRVDVERPTKVNFFLSSSLSSLPCFGCCF